MPSRLTVFMFSIQTASTGPSNRTHFLSGLVSVAMSLNSLASTPSFHSWLMGSNWPYSWPIVMLLGFITHILTLHVLLAIMLLAHNQE